MVNCIDHAIALTPYRKANCIAKRTLVSFVDAGQAIYQTKNSKQLILEAPGLTSSVSKADNTGDEYPALSALLTELAHQGWLS